MSALAATLALRLNAPTHTHSVPIRVASRYMSVNRIATPIIHSKRKNIKLTQLGHEHGIKMRVAPFTFVHFIVHKHTRRVHGAGGYDSEY